MEMGAYVSNAMSVYQRVSCYIVLANRAVWRLRTAVPHQPWYSCRVVAVVALENVHESLALGKPTTSEIKRPSNMTSAQVPKFPNPDLVLIEAPKPKP